MGIGHLPGRGGGCPSHQGSCRLSAEGRTPIQPCAGISSILLSQQEGFWVHLSLLLFFLILEAKYNLL